MCVQAATGTVELVCVPEFQPPPYTVLFASISINQETVDVTTKDSSRVRELLAQGGIKSFTISGSGVFDDSASHQTVLSDFDSATFTNYQFIVPDYNTFTGSFQVTAIEYSGTYNDSAQYSLTFESAGEITIATV